MNGLGALLPPGVAFAEQEGTLDEAALLPAERELVGRAAPARRLEFATSRHCARRALAAVGVDPVPILRDGARAPAWPRGIAGSITHSGSYHAAAVASTRSFRAIGIDAEPDEPLPPEVLEVVSRPEERQGLDTSGGRLLFSAKESVYKAWYPLARGWLGFEDAVITVRLDGTFAARILVPGPLTTVEGRWRQRNGLILTAVAVPA